MDDDAARALFAATLTDAIGLHEHMKQHVQPTIALTGNDGGAVGRSATVHVNVPSSSAARVQEVHRTLLHVICDIVERDIA